MSTPSSMPQVAGAPQSIAYRPRAVRLAQLFWLGFLAYPIASLLTPGRPLWSVIGGFGGLGIFVALYLYLMLVRPLSSLTPGDRRRRWPPALCILGLLAILLNVMYGTNWLGLFVYLVVASVLTLPLAVIWPVIGGIALTTGVIGYGERGDPVEVLIMTGVTLATGSSMVGVVQLVSTMLALRAARDDAARLAVAEERLRFARDLHDILGQSLSVIALKSELASRLIGAAPQQATSEMADVQRVARDALQQVREAVAGYHRPTLTAELRNAREVLEAAGIVCVQEVPTPLSSMPLTHETALAWTVREAVTNVIRHSHATLCTIRLALGAETADLVIADDGRGGSTPCDHGTGLRGVCERIGHLSGQCSAGPQPQRGFEVQVRLPLVARESAP